MPCMGPNLNAIAKDARGLGETMLAELIAEHHLFDIADARLPRHWCPLGAKDRWLGAKEAFLKSVETLFIEDACNSF